jgi:hypothetical protein
LPPCRSLVRRQYGLDYEITHGLGHPEKLAFDNEAIQELLDGSAVPILSCGCDEPGILVCWGRSKWREPKSCDYVKRNNANV